MLSLITDHSTISYIETLSSACARPYARVSCLGLYRSSYGGWHSIVHFEARVIMKNEFSFDCTPNRSLYWKVISSARCRRRRVIVIVILVIVCFHFVRSFRAECVRARVIVSAPLHLHLKAIVSAALVSKCLNPWQFHAIAVCVPRHITFVHINIIWIAIVVCLEQ